MAGEFGMRCKTEYLQSETFFTASTLRLPSRSTKVALYDGFYNHLGFGQRSSWGPSRSQPSNQVPASELREAVVRSLEFEGPEFAGYGG
jgi:hypothetical protein